MSNTARGIAAAVILAGAAVGFASPAWADDMNGTYTWQDSNGDPPHTWIVTPCGPGCAHLFDSTSGHVHYAYLDGGQWSYSWIAPDAVKCRAGGNGPGTYTNTWDAATLNGTNTSTSPIGSCGDTAPKTYVNLSFTLTKVG
jgi:hypothetical protein